MSTGTKQKRQEEDGGMVEERPRERMGEKLIEKMGEEVPKSHTYFSWIGDDDSVVSKSHTDFSWGRKGGEARTQGKDWAKQLREELSQAALPSETPGWKVFALQVGRSNHGLPGSVLVESLGEEERVEMGFYCFCCVGHGRVVMVDCGFFSETCVKAFQVESFIHPRDLVQRCGVSCDSVTDVVITHGHWDHLNGVHLFPNAQLWISEREFDFIVNTPFETGKYSSRRWLTKMGLADVANEIGPNGISPADATLLADAALQGRLNKITFHKNKRSLQLADGLFVVDAHGSHTPGSVYVVVTKHGDDHSGEPLVLASDSAMLYDNLRDTPIATGCCESYFRNVQTLREMRALTPNRRIIPGHDLRVSVAFAVVAPGVFDLGQPM